MADEIAIVLIPQKHTTVWKVSSDKVPHVTLCYLGDPGWSAEQLRNVLDFVGHTASMTHQMWLYPEDRGTLGPKEADVLFFSKRDNDRLMDLRQNLLGNDEIRKAYNDAAMFPEWTPHLTLGYPDDPAKEPDEGQLWGIEFNRIAVWTGDFEGVEYKLPIQDFAEVAMSGSATTSDILEHYGVKGMKWGVRGSASGGASSRPASKPNTTRTHFQRSPKSLSTADLKRRIERMEIEVRYNKLNRPDVSEGRQLAQEILRNTGARIVRGVLNAESDRVVATYMRVRR